ncbi:MAG: hypothetical protein J5I50_05920 [Chitinophagaceae bacterium]|nr:hypothetical protein [Chitinophagaceae bacterium]
MSFSLQAQYYYNDILTIKKSNDEYQKLKKAQYRTVTLESFEFDDSPSQGFFCERKLNNDFSESVMISRSDVTGESELRSYYKDGRVYKTVNTNGDVINTAGFEYNTVGQLQKVTSSTVGVADSSRFEEVREYEYDADGVLTALRRFKNGVQVSMIKFEKDENGNIVEEVPAQVGVDRKYYYYYDDKNRLTDVVRFNDRAQRLLPDYMFLYNETRRDEPSQMISVDESAETYVVWRYAYTPDGLPEIQKCYSKEKQLLGTIQYEYR